MQNFYEPTQKVSKESYFTFLIKLVATRALTGYDCAGYFWHL